MKSSVVVFEHALKNNHDSITVCRTMNKKAVFPKAKTRIRKIIRIYILGKEL